MIVELGMPTPQRCLMKPDTDRPFSVVTRRSGYHDDTEGWPYKCERLSLS